MAEKQYEVLGKKERKIGGKKVGVSLWLADKKTGETTQRTLLNPHGKGVKYAQELATGQHFTNDFHEKKDNKGRALRITDTQAAFRSGYLQAQKDSARAYNAKNK